jgi:T-complex protein 1 subunit theta
VAKFLKSVLAAKQYGYEDTLAPLVAKACVDVCPAKAEHFNVDNV